MANTFRTPLYFPIGPRPYMPMADALPSLLVSTLSAVFYPYTPVDWPSTPRRPDISPVLLPNRVQGAPTVLPPATSPPFMQTDWQSPIQHFQIDADSEHLLYLPLPQPFTPVDWPSAPVMFRAQQLIDVVNLIGTVLKPTPGALPVGHLYDWFAPQGVRTQRPTELFPNLQLSTLPGPAAALPVAHQYDWFAPVRHIDPPNIEFPNLQETTLPGPPQAFPFGLYEWPNVVRPYAGQADAVPLSVLFLIQVIPVPPASPHGLNRFYSNEILGVFKSNHIPGRFRQDE